MNNLVEALRADISVGEHFNMELSPLDRMAFEHSVENSIVIEGLPARHPYFIGVARKIERLGVPFKMAYLTAYMIHHVGESREVSNFYISEIKARGFEPVYNEIKTLFWELYRLLPKDEVISLKEGDSEFHTINLVPIDLWEELEEEPPAEAREEMETIKKQEALDEQYRLKRDHIVKKIMTSTRSNIAERGKKLYEWCNLDTTRSEYPFEDIGLFWRVYKETKKRLLGRV